jgi:hypothetical protein
MKKVVLKGKFKFKKRVIKNNDDTIVELWMVREIPVDGFYRILEARCIQETTITKEIAGLCPQTISSQPETYVVLSLQDKRGRDMVWVQGHTYSDMRLFVPDPKEQDTWKWLFKEEAKNAFVEFLAKTYGVELEINDSIVF